MLLTAPYARSATPHSAAYVAEPVTFGRPSALGRRPADRRARGKRLARCSCCRPSDAGKARRRVRRRPFRQGAALAPGRPSGAAFVRRAHARAPVRRRSSSTGGRPRAPGRLLPPAACVDAVTDEQRLGFPRPPGLAAVVHRSAPPQRELKQADADTDRDTHRRHELPAAADQRSGLPGALLRRHGDPTCASAARRGVPASDDDVLAERHDAVRRELEVGRGISRVAAHQGEQSLAPVGYVGA